MDKLVALKKLVDNKDAIGIANLIKKHNLVIDKGKITVPTATVKELTDYWDKRQLVRKILLNSASTGALN